MFKKKKKDDKLFNIAVFAIAFIGYMIDSSKGGLFGSDKKKEPEDFRFGAIFEVLKNIDERLTALEKKKNVKKKTSCSCSKKA